MAANSSKHNPLWTVIIPVISMLILGIYALNPHFFGIVTLLSLGLIGSVIAAVHHAEVIAHRVGEPFGTLVLAMAVTIIEVALIVSMMMSGGEATMGLARDTIFAAVMIILNGIIGASLLLGARKHLVQDFSLEGVTAALGTMTVIVTFALILPSFSTTAPGPVYTSNQLMFVAIMTLVLFAAFTFFQTVRHRDYFLPVVQETDLGNIDSHANPPNNKDVGISFVCLLLSLVAVVLSAKGISPALEKLLSVVGAPAATLGIIIAASC